MTALPIIDDSNYTLLLPKTGNVFEFNGPRILGAIPPKAGPGLCAAAPGADFPLIPRDAWPDLIRKKDREKTWLEDIVRGVIPCNDQNGLNYCHAYGTVMKAMCQRLVQYHAYVELSAESVGGPITNWRDAGADPTDDMAQMAKYGACPASYMDQPHSRNPSRWKAGWEQVALDYRATDWVDGRTLGNTFDVAATMAILGAPPAAGFYWWSHYISGPYRLLDLGGRKYALRYRNNWGPAFGDDGFVDFAEGKGTPDWLFAVMQMSVIDNIKSGQWPTLV